MGSKGERRLPFKKRKGVIQIQMVPRHTTIKKEWRGANLYVLAPNPPMRARSSPPFLRNIIKRRGWLPRTQIKIMFRGVSASNNVAPLVSLQADLFTFLKVCTATFHFGLSSNFISPFGKRLPTPCQEPLLPSV